MMEQIAFFRIKTLVKSEFWQAIDLLIGQKKRSKDYQFALKEWLIFLGADPFSDEDSEIKFYSATYQQASKYMTWQSVQRGGVCTVPNHIRAKLRANATIIKRYDILKHIYTKAKELGFLEVNPFALVKPPSIHVGKKQPTYAITIEQAKKMMQLCLNSRHGRLDLAILSALLGAGLRRSEGASLRLCDVKDSSLFLYATKTKRDYNQEVNLHLMENIHRWKAERIAEGAKDTDLLFEVSDRTINRIVKKYATWSGIPESITAHSLRASFATLLLDSGIGIDEVCRAMRHDNIQSTLAYDKRRKTGADNCVNKLDF